jgi:putative Holliday junction resolvase
VQQKETDNSIEFPDISTLPATGRILAIDPGTKRVGVAISDESRLIATPLSALEKTSWKKLLADVSGVIAKFDAALLVVGLPLNSDGSESPMSEMARDWAAKFNLSLDVPVVLQDERVTSYEARRRLWDERFSPRETKTLVDSQAAAVILGDFLDRLSSTNKPN